MNVDINTKMVTLLGKPLGQSFAARMQNAAYEAAGFNMIYYYTEVQNDHDENGKIIKDNLGSVVAGLRQQNIAGFAVTKPNKTEILKYLDELDELCAKMGASNTVVKTADGKLKGYNTDGVGFYTSLIETTNLKPEENVFFSFGAGGVASAMDSMLAYKGAKKIYITDYFDSASTALVESINKNFAPIAEFIAFNDKDAIKAALQETDVIMNCTGIGMAPHLGETPVPKEWLKPNQVCFDACYNPDKTQFLLDAESIGCTILNGLDMSMYQGAAQIELWTGKPAPTDVMRNELLKIIAEG